MARLDPDHFPDRFALDRYARQMRNQEIERTTRAIARGLLRLIRQVGSAQRPAPSRRPARAH